MQEAVNTSKGTVHLSCSRIEIGKLLVKSIKCGPINIRASDQNFIPGKSFSHPWILCLFIKWGEKLYQSLQLCRAKKFFVYAFQQKYKD